MASKGSARRCRAACRESSRPFGALQTSQRAAKVAPDLMPTKMPFLLARATTHLHRVRRGIVMMRSITFMSTASPVSFGMKSGLQPCIGCGFKAGCGAAGEPSALRSCCVPLASIGASAGSQTTILVSGLSLASTRATPLSVPPVPKPVTQ